MVNLVKIKNKNHGYHCDRCKMVHKFVYSDNNGFLCETHALEKFGEEAVKNAELEDD